MLVQDPQTGYLHEVPDYHVAGYGGYDGYDGYGWYGGYGEEPDPQAQQFPDPQTPPIPPPPVPPPMQNEDAANMYPEGAPYPAPAPAPWQYWFRQWGLNPLMDWRRRQYWRRYGRYGTWPRRWTGWARGGSGWPGRWSGWARRWARPRTRMMAARGNIFRPGRAYVRDHRRR